MTALSQSTRRKLERFLAYAQNHPVRESFVLSLIYCGRYALLTRSHSTSRDRPTTRCARTSRSFR